MFVQHHFAKSALLAVVLTSVDSIAWAEGLGTLYKHGQSTRFVDAYACTESDMLHEGKVVTVVAFADGMIDKAAANAADDHCRELTHQVGKKFTTLSEIKIWYDGRFANIQTYDANGTNSRSDGTLKLTRNDGTRVEGSFAGNPAKKKDGIYFDLHFALDVAGAKK